MPRDEDLLDQNFPEEEARAKGLRILSLFAIGVVVIFLVAIGYIYMSGNHAADPDHLPLITENNPPQKSRPADPGGMEIPHQDASVYDHLDAKQAADQPEKLLPPPEAPVTQADQQTNRPADQNAAPATMAATVPEQLPSLPSNAPAAQQAAVADKAAPNAATQAPPVVTPAPAQAAQTNTAAPVQTAQPVVADNSQVSYRIQLGAVRDQAAADKEWARMESKYSSDLKGLNSSFTPVSLGDKGTFLRIQAGPLSKEEAEARCAKLKGENQACLIVKAAQ